MQKLSQLEFNRGVWFYNEDITIIPTFGGFFVAYADKIVTSRPLNEQEALKLANNLFKGIEGLTGDEEYMALKQLAGEM